MEDDEFLWDGERWVECVDEAVLSARETRREDGLEMGEGGAGLVGIKLAREACLLFLLEEVVEEGVIAAEEGVRADFVNVCEFIRFIGIVTEGLVALSGEEV